jgi:ABC-type branched-subunit amino acid transport system ATPase component/ABC-type branched-subunit amino acid transport system permease subunit
MSILSALPAMLRLGLRLPSRRTVLRVVALLGFIGLVKVLLLVLDDTGVYRFSTPLPVVLLGAIIGMTYGLLATGLVLIYRSNRIINFAHGQIGAFGAAVFGLVVSKYGVPYWLAFVGALLVSALAGVAAEAGVVRRLRLAPRIVSVVATLGFGQFLLLFAAAVNSTVASGAAFPEPSWLPQFQFGALLVTPAYCGMLILSPLVALGIAAFLRYSSFGLALRSSAANPEAARLAGIFASRMSSLAWALAGVLSAFSAILTQPTQGYVAPATFGPALLLRALTGAALARMESIPIALAGGIGLGVLEQTLLWNYPHGGLVEAALFVIIMVSLLLQPRRFGRDEEKGSWAAVQALRPVPEVLRRIWLVRHLGSITALASFAVLLLLPLVISNSDSVTVTGIMAFSVVGLSVGILTGLGGQLTLGQFAVGAVGAVVAIHFSNSTGNFFLAILYGSLVAAVVSLIIGLPALRLRGLMLTVTTLSFALATQAWLLAEPWALGGGLDPASPRIAGHTLSTGKSYFYFGAGLLAIAGIIARNVRRSGFGRLLVAVRDNEDAARAFTVPVAVVRMQGYLVAGFIAGIGGAVFGYTFTHIDQNTFPATASVNVVVMTVLGGVSLLAGPILGAMYVLGIPAFLPLDTAGLAATQLGALLLILFLPGGLGSLGGRARDWVVGLIGRAKGIDVKAAYAGNDPPAAEVQPADVDVAAVDEPDQERRIRRSVATASPTGHQPDLGRGVMLDARHLGKRFGGVVAVDDVSLSVRRGETVGLIGPNGAGKTTTFEMLAGFTTPDRGTVMFEGRDVSWYSPEARARLGLVRSFQDAALFPTMTVTEVVELALEAVIPAKFLSSLIGYSPGERQKRRRARELVGQFGLDPYRDRTIQELSTGTRRITEIACLIAASPKMLLLDEPSSGVAQRDTA